MARNSAAAPTLALVLALLASAARVQASPALDAIHAARDAAITALAAGDLSKAEADAEALQQLAPNSPAVFVLRTRIAERRGDRAAALRALDQYAATGLASHAWADPSLAALAADPGLAPIRRRFEANERPTGTLAPVATVGAGPLGAGPLLAEAVARDASRDRWLVSSVHRRTILQIDGAGRVRPYLAADAGLWGVFNLAIDARRSVLWASTAAAPQSRGFSAADRGVTALVKIDLESGRILARYAPPPKPDRSFGDLAIGADGTVYVSDSGAGEVWRLRHGAVSLERLDKGGLGSPQGIVPTPDGRRLIVADYSSGLEAIDLASGAVSHLAVPADAALVGSDGVSRRGVSRSLIIVQNGIAPQRVIQVDLDRSWSRVTAWRVLAANLPQMSEPTGGVVAGGRFVFLPRSQWAAFADDGALKAPDPAPPLIASLPLS
jgi:hypothetical protein